MNKPRTKVVAQLPGYEKTGRIYGGGGALANDRSEGLQGSRQDTHPGRSERMRIQNATAQGYMEAEDGDGIVLNFLGRARGRVQPQRSPTVNTGGGARGA